MSILRNNPRTDANQSEIISYLRERGALVVPIGRPVDLLVGIDGIWVLMEVKVSPKAKIQKSQKEFLNQCAIAGVPCYLIHDVEQLDFFFPSESTGSPESPARQGT